MSSIIRRLIIASQISIIGFALAACSPMKENANIPQSHESIFADRPIGMTTDILMVQLFEPALLENEVTPERVAALQREQQIFEEKLLQISAQIQILYRYRFTVNGMAIVTPTHLIPKIKAALDIKQMEIATPLSRPLSQLAAANVGALNEGMTSVSFLGATELHKQGVRGQGVKVGVIDTGIDYTHSMLGGSGNPEDYKAVDPNKATPAFPNGKVVGGIDLAGSRFTGGSDLYDLKVPRPDGNPLDEQGHGTHVAGTIGGVGDTVNTYDGVAPDADLYAIKVFGKTGGTFDAIVIAGFEYAVDPNGDMNPNDRLDVVNLSLGGGYGNPKILYAKAIKNLVQSGMTVVAAAGNDGDVRSIVGAPATADEALSVAASVDGRDINWKFATIKIFPDQGESIVSEYVEGAITKPLKDIPSLRGKLVDIGKADQDLTEDQKKALQGNIALIQRGVVTFVEKIKKAQEGGAIAALVYQSEDGPPIAMGGAEDGSDKFAIPGVMIEKATGEKIVAALKTGNVEVDFKNADIVEKPELIDTITDFSSRGPRTDDYGFKPEVAAPGFQILSAAVGEGNKGVLNNGTSMASPHVAGLVALMKQKYPNISPEDVKALFTSTALPMKSKDSKPYLFTSQGAGRVQLLKALETPLVVSAPRALGLVEVPDAATATTTISLKNISEAPVQADLRFSGTEMTGSLPSTVTINPGETQNLELSVQVQNGAVSENRFSELDGVVKISGNGFELQVPILAFRIQKSEIIAGAVKEVPLPTNSPVTSTQEKKVTLTLENTNAIPGSVSVFNLIGLDEKKQSLPGETWRSDACDLKSAGYRLIEKTVSGKNKTHLQFAVQLYDTKSHLKSCDFSILVDGDGDGQPDQEIIGIGDRSVYGFQGQEHFAVILDYAKAQQIRLLYEVQVGLGMAAGQDYRAAAVALGALNFNPDSGLTTFEVPVEALKVNATGDFQAKVVAINNIGDAIEMDDYLDQDDRGWRTLSTQKEKMGSWGFQDVNVAGDARIETSFSRTFDSKGDLIVYSTTNSKALESQVLRKP